jgi:hypothetical protein
MVTHLHLYLKGSPLVPPWNTTTSTLSSWIHRGKQRRVMGKPPDHNATSLVAHDATSEELRSKTTGLPSIFKSVHD